MQATRTAVLAGFLLASAVAAQAQVLSVGGTYPTHAALIAGRNTCGTVTIQDNVTTVTHTAGQHTLSLTHAGTTYDATVDDNGVFVSSPKELNAGGAQYTIVVDGLFGATGFGATVTLQVRQQTAPATCSYAVSWIGTKQGAPNAIPGIPRDGRAVIVRHFAGSGIDGSTDGPVGSAAFSFPIGIAMDRNGMLVVADGDFAVRRITPGGIVSTIAGAPGSAGFRDGGPGDARFAGLHGIAVDSHANLFVTDNPNHAVRRIAPDGTVTTFAGDGTAGSEDGTGAAVRLNFPHDLAIDAQDNLYVADVANHTIRRITPSGVVTTFAGQAGQRGSVDGRGSQARFEFPSSLAIDAAGNVWVGGNGTVRRIAPDATVTTIAGANGVSGSTDGQGAAARFQGPEGLAFAPNGDLYIASGSTLRKMDREFRVTTAAGVAGLTGDAEGLGAAARLQLPLGIVVSSESRIYFADAAGNRIFSAVPDDLACTDSASRLCLDANRFSVMLYARDPHTATEGGALSHRVNARFGYFSIPALTGHDRDPEVFVKAIDAPANGAFSIIYGGLTDLEYTLTVLDTRTGLAVPLVRGEGSACGAFDTGSIPAPAPPPAVPAGRRRAVHHPWTCAPDALCLADGRLRITIHARDPQTGFAGEGAPIAGGGNSFGAFSVPARSGDRDDAEVFLKVVDERAGNGTFSLLHGGLTDLEYTIAVTDTVTGQVVHFTHPTGSRCGDFTTFGF